MAVKKDDRPSTSVRYEEGHPLYKPPSEQTAQYPVEKPGEPIPQEILEGQAQYLEQPKPKPDYEESPLSEDSEGSKEPKNRGEPKKPTTSVTRRK